MFSHNGANWPEWNMACMFCPVRQVAALGPKSPTSSCFWGNKFIKCFAMLLQNIKHAKRVMRRSLHEVCTINQRWLSVFSVWCMPVLYQMGWMNQQSFNALGLQFLTPKILVKFQLSDRYLERQIHMGSIWSHLAISMPIQGCIPNRQSCDLLVGTWLIYWVIFEGHFRNWKPPQGHTESVTMITRLQNLQPSHRICLLL